MDVYSELIKAQAEHLSSNPGTHIKGRIFFNTTSNTLYFDDGTTFHEVFSDQMFADIPTNYNTGSSSGSFFTSSTTFVDVTNMECTITTTGKPVEIFLYGGVVSVLNSSAGLARGAFRLDVDGIAQTTNHVLQAEANSPQAGIEVPSSCIRFVLFPSAGTYTYKLQASAYSSSVSVGVQNCFMMAKEF